MKTLSTHTEAQSSNDYFEKGNLYRHNTGSFIILATNGRDGVVVWVGGGTSGPSLGHHMIHVIVQNFFPFEGFIKMTTKVTDK